MMPKQILKDQYSKTLKDGQDKFIGALYATSFVSIVMNFMFSAGASLLLRLIDSLQIVCF